jgi:hypothetical protein
MRFPMLVAAATCVVWTAAGGEVQGGELQRYGAKALHGVGSLVRLRSELGASRLLEVLKLNRIDLDHATRLDTLIIPEPSAAFIDLTPFPSYLKGVDSLGKVLLVAVRIQAFAAYEHGRLARWGPVCTGGASSPTSPGYYTANWKARHHVSSTNETWIMPYTVNVDLRVGTALHEYALPGIPSSHCCMRLMEDDARWVFEWVEVIPSAPGRAMSTRGTGVVVFGEYDFQSVPPWKNLQSNPAATHLSEKEIDEAIHLIPSISGPPTKEGQ